MFSAIFSAIVGGGPAEWAALALGAVLLLGGTFAAGAFYEAQHIAVTAGATAAKAQKAYDTKQAAASGGVSKAVTADHAAGDAVVAPIIKMIHDKGATVYVRVPTNDPTACDLTPSTLNQLNEAGHQ